MGWGAAVGGLASAVGSFAGGKSTNKKRRKEAKRNREFQERMSSTAYQRSMEDMKTAGLNPMLAYMKGGASSPGGSMASLENPVPDVSRSIESAVNTAQSFKRTNSEINNIKQNTLKSKAETDLAEQKYKTNKPDETQAGATDAVYKYLIDLATPSATNMANKIKSGVRSIEKQVTTPNNSKIYHKRTRQSSKIKKPTGKYTPPRHKRQKRRN